MTDRDRLLHAIQEYAEEWKSGKSPHNSPAKVALCIELDRYEFDLIHEIEERTKKQCQEKMSASMMTQNAPGSG